MYKKFNVGLFIKTIKNYPNKIGYLWKIAETFITALKSVQESCAVLISFKIVVLSDKTTTTTSATIFKEMRITQLSS